MPVYRGAPAVVDNKVLIDATTSGGTVISDHYNWSDKKTGAVRRGVAEYILPSVLVA